MAPRMSKYTVPIALSTGWSVRHPMSHIDLAGVRYMPIRIDTGFLKKRFNSGSRRSFPRRGGGGGEKAQPPEHAEQVLTL